MNYTIKRESFDSLASCWDNPSCSLRWNSLFVLPAWLKAWWQELGAGAELHLDAVRQGEEVIGISPLPRARLANEFLTFPASLKCQKSNSSLKTK